MNNKVIFSVTEEDLQKEAVTRIGRQLTDDEFHVASKGMDWGLSFDIETVFASAIDEAVEQTLHRHSL